MATRNRFYPDHELALENTVLKLCRAVTELAAAVDRLAVKEHYKYQDDERPRRKFPRIQQSLTNAKRELEAIADTFDAASQWRIGRGSLERGFFSSAPKIGSIG